MASIPAPRRCAACPSWLLAAQNRSRHSCGVRRLQRWVRWWRQRHRWRLQGTRAMRCYSSGGPGCPSKRPFWVRVRAVSRSVSALRRSLSSAWARRSCSGSTSTSLSAGDSNGFTLEARAPLSREAIRSFFPVSGCCGAGGKGAYRTLTQGLGCGSRAVRAMARRAAIAELTASVWAFASKV